MGGEGGSAPQAPVAREEGVAGTPATGDRGTLGPLPRGAGVAAILLAFASGFGILLLEVVGARLIGDAYGLSSIPWTLVIATVLGGLALGNTLGGFAADRGWLPLSHLFLGAALWTAVPALTVTYPYRLLLRFGYLEGATISALLYFLVPSILMGAVTPILVQRMTRRLEEVGLRFGDVGAWSTLGAIAGTLSGGFLLLPILPITSILALVGGFYLLVSALAAALEGSRVRALLPLLALPLLLLMVRAPSPNRGAVFAGQSLYSSMAVWDTEWGGGLPVRELWQNGSLSSVEDRITGEPVHLYQIALGWLLLDRITSLESVLWMGGAANTFPTQLKRWSPELQVTIVEIDPLVVRVAEEYFAFGRLEPDAVRVVVQDARTFLRRDSGRYDLVVSDAYDHLYSVPWILMTRESFLGMEARLADGGMAVLTLSTPIEGPGAAFIRRVAATFASVFPYTRIYLSQPDLEPNRTQEVILVGTRAPEDLPVRDEVPWIDLSTQGTPLLHDDFAPVEFLQAVRFYHDPQW